MATWKLGAHLSPETQRDALAQFVMRMTIENLACRPDVRRLNAGYRLRIISDAEWLATTRFAVTSYGKLDMRVRWCESNHPDRAMSYAEQAGDGGSAFAEALS